MERNDAILAKASNLISEHLGVKPERVKPTALFVDDLGADSLDTIELVMVMEDEFGIALADTEVEPIRTVNDLIIVLAAHTPLRGIAS